MTGNKCLRILEMSNEVWWTSRRVGGFFSKEAKYCSVETKSGWIYKYKGVESKIYDTKADAFRALEIEVLLKGTV